MKSGYLPIIIEIVIREINTLESRLDLLKGYDRENISLDKNKQLDDLER